MLLQALNEFYERATKPDANGDVLIEEAAFNQKYVRWIIPLKTDGTLEGGGLIENPEIKKGGRLFSVPRTGRAKKGREAEFLTDGIDAIFGLNPDIKKPKNEEMLAKKHKDFWRQIEQGFRETNSPLLNSVLQFRDNFTKEENLNFLRWGSLKEADQPCWLIKTSSGTEEKYKAENFTFQMNGDFLFESKEIRQFWRSAFADERSSSESDSEKSLCLVTGKTDVAVPASHLPKISGFLSTGASLISFDKDSFRSYGLEKSYNAPVSFSAVEAYTNSLNFLLSNPKHRLRIGDTTLVFWAQKSEDATDMFADLFDQPDEKTIMDFMKKPFTGDENLYDFTQEQFYSVTLGGNAGRIVVRNWMQMTVLQAANNFKKWFEDLKLVQMRSHENDKIAPLNLFLLAKSTVREAKDLRPEIPTQLYRAALENHAPSLIVAKGLLNRIAVDLAKDGRKSLGNLSRFALLKLIINRNEKEESKMINPDLNEIEDYPYNCGRLLAVFEDLQAVYHGKDFTGASVVEKYYGTAASSPNSAFGILWRLHQHHLRKVSRTFPGVAVNLRKKIEGITQHFERQNPADLKSPPQFPRSFNLQEQGRFALGFYQQCAADRKAGEERKAQKKAEQTNQSETQGEQE
jgi:CRISPR-associated protein Csd1